MFVTGCHRSGTSLLASVLRALINQESSESSELASKLDNPRGFQESIALNQLNNQLLDLAGSRWDQPPLLPLDWSAPVFFDVLFKAREDFASLSLQQTWIEKNPRFCITGPAMEHLLLRRVPYAVSLRAPAAVAVSLFRRNGISFQRGLLIWFLYNYHLASFLQPQDLLVTYESLLEDQTGAVHERCCGFLSSNGAEPDASSYRVFSQIAERPLNRAGQGSFDLSGCSPVLLNCCGELFQICLEAEGNVEVFKSTFSYFPAPILEALAASGLWTWSV